MTTEHCSVDSLLPKSRTETFARQLQNRLRTLNNEIERDGPEDTSWNGDQLSSSSDDIYYDLDSYPGSPAEEATETNFGDYLSAKTSQNAHSATSTNTFLNHHENTINHYENINGTQGICSNKTEKGLICNGYCTNGNFEDSTVPTSNERLHDSSYQNGLSSLENHQLSNGNKNEHVTNITGISCTNLTHSRSDLSGTSNSFNGIKDRLLHNGDSNNITQNHTVDVSEYKNHHEEPSKLDEHCSCHNVSNNRTQPIDVNSNSTSSNNNVDNLSNNNFTNKGNETIMDSDSSVTNTTRSTKSDSNDSLGGNYKLHLELENHEQGEINKAEKYTEADLCKLVDAVFLKSQETDFDTYSSQTKIDNVNRMDCDHDNEEEETIECKRSKFRRSSSLKTGKTPPGTPGCKKIVRFADVLGLDLADVRTFLDEIPRVPKSAFTDLKDVELPSSPPVNMLDTFMGHMTTSPIMRVQRTIVPLFQQPSSRLEFLDRIRDNSVCLENAVVTDPALFVVTGYVRVKNIDFHKSVHIRYSIDNWKSFADLQAKYVPNSCDGFSDKFTFVLYAHMLNVGQRLEFAVRYHTGGCIFWDNNLGANYTFQCVPEGPTKVLPTVSYIPPNPIETWASFY